MYMSVCVRMEEMERVCVCVAVRERERRRERERERLYLFGQTGKRILYILPVKKA